MVGQGVLRECLLDPEVEAVTTIGRRASGMADPKLTDLVHGNMLDFSDIRSRLSGFDACFFCLGVSSLGLTKEAYRRVTYDITLAAAETLVGLNPGMTFVYVSGAGTDSTGRGRSMWARVKGATENALLRLPFKAAYMFRPGLIVPLLGIRSKTPVYRIFYVAARPLLPILEALMPGAVTTTEKIGKAMLTAAREGAAKPVLDTADINALARPLPAPPAPLPAR
jgi:uncharacterized protein YbjT (DUF2867 family)